jgi:hypothetical protein
VGERDLCFVFAMSRAVTGSALRHRDTIYALALLAVDVAHRVNADPAEQVGEEGGRGPPSRGGEGGLDF